MNRHWLVEDVSRKAARKRPGRFDIGDTVDVHVRIREADRERVQVFSGTVIARKGSGSDASFTVRRLVGGEGVERVFPLYSPRVEKVVVAKRGKVRRAKLTYLRERAGRSARIEELRGEEEVVPEAAATEPGESEAEPGETAAEEKAEGKKG